MQNQVAALPRRTRARDAATTRDAIIAMAATLFYERGFRGVTIEEICASLDPPLTKGAYYHIFDSKDAVLFAIHDKYMGEAMRYLDDIAAMDARRKFEALFRHSAELLGTMRPFVVVTILEQRHLQGRHGELAQKLRREYRLAIERAVRDGQRDGVLRSDIDAKILTLNYFAIVNWMYMWFREGGRFSRDKVTAACCEQFLAGAAGPARPTRRR